MFDNDSPQKLNYSEQSRELYAEITPFFTQSWVRPSISSFLPRLFWSTLLFDPDSIRVSPMYVFRCKMGGNQNNYCTLPRHERTCSYYDYQIQLCKRDILWSSCWNTWNKKWNLNCFLKPNLSTKIFYLLF